MIIYNVTVNVEYQIVESWNLWIKPHIKKVLETGNFEKAVLAKVLSNDDGYTFSIQYYAKSRQALNEYYDLYAEHLRKETYEAFGNQIIGFRTELEILEVFEI